MSISRLAIAARGHCTVVAYVGAGRVVRDDRGVSGSLDAHGFEALLCPGARQAGPGRTR
jgi:hypothetical protein